MDFTRFAELHVIASMQPSHQTTDMRWAEDRIGRERIMGAYAWATMLKNKVPLAFDEEADRFLVKSLEEEPLNVWALSSASNAELLIHKYSDAIAHARKAHSIPHQGLAGVHIVAALALEATQQPLEAVKEYQLYLDEDPKGRDAERARKAITRLSESAPK